MPNFVRGLGIPVAVVTAVSSATGCYPVAEMEGELELVAGGTCEPDLAVEVGILAGGTTPTYRQRDVVSGERWNYWTEPAYFRGVSGRLTQGMPAWGQVRGVGMSSGVSVWVHDHDAADYGIRVVELAEDGTATEKAQIELAGSSLGASVWPVLALDGAGGGVVWYVLGGRVQSMISADLVAWERGQTLWALADVTRLEGHITATQGMLLAQTADGWQQLATHDGGETWQRVGSPFAGGQVAVTAHASGAWVVAVRAATSPYQTTVRVLGDVLQPVLCGAGQVLPYTAQNQPVVLVADPAGDVWLSQRDGALYVSSDAGRTWAAREASSGADLRAGAWAGVGVVWAWQDADLAVDELAFTQGGGWDGASQWRDSSGGAVGSVRHRVPVAEWPGLSGTTGAGAVSAVDWQHWRLDGGGGLGSSYISEYWAGLVEIDLDIDQTGTDYVELLLSTEVEASGQFAIVTVRLGRGGAVVVDKDGVSVGVLVYGGEARGRIAVAVGYDAWDEAEVVVRWVPASATAAVVTQAVNVPWSAVGHADVASGDGWVLRTRAASAGVQTIYVYRVMSGATAALETAEMGRGLSRWPAVMRDGVTLQRDRGSAARGDTGAVAAAFRYGAEALEDVSSSRRWVAETDDETVTFDMAQGRALEGLVALYVEGELDSASVIVGGVEVVALDMSAGHAGLSFTATGQTLLSAAGAESRWLERNELAGGWAVWAGGKGRIVSHDSGIWGRAATLRMVVEGDLPPGSGTVTVYAPQAVVMWQQEADASAVSVAVVGVDGQPVVMRQCRLVQVVQLLRQWQHGEQVSQVALAQVAHDAAGRGSVAGVAGYVEVRIDWQSEPVELGNTGYLAGASTTLHDVLGAVRAHGGKPLLLIRQAEVDETTTARLATVWGRVTTPVTLTLVHDGEGDEVGGGYWRAEALTIRQEL